MQQAGEPCSRVIDGDPGPMLTQRHQVVVQDVVVLHDGVLGDLHHEQVGVVVQQCFLHVHRP